MTPNLEIEDSNPKPSSLDLAGRTSVKLMLSAEDDMFSHLLLKTLYTYIYTHICVYIYTDIHMVYIYIYVVIRFRV